MAEGEDNLERTRMTLGEHLDELRRRLIKGMVAVALAFCVGWAFYEEVGVVIMTPLQQVLTWLDEDQVETYEEKLAKTGEPRSTYFVSDDPTERELHPELRVARRPQATGFAEPFIFALKISLYFALFLGAPVLLWQLWQFVAAGLYRREQGLVLRYFPISVGLFLAGVLFGYFFMVPYGMYFLARAFPPQDIYLQPKISEYLTLLTGLTLALGAVFQLPIVIYALVKLDLVQRRTLSRYRPHFIVCAFVIAALLTPPDPFTQSLMAVPMVVLFEVGLFFSRFAEQPAVIPEADQAGTSGEPA